MGSPGGSGLTFTEQRAHFALWAIIKSPLIIGADLRCFTPWCIIPFCHCAVGLCMHLRLDLLLSGDALPVLHQVPLVCAFSHASQAHWIKFFASLRACCWSLISGPSALTGPCCKCQAFSAYDKFGFCSRNKQAMSQI